MLWTLQERWASHLAFYVSVGGASELSQGNEPNTPTVLNQIIVVRLTEVLALVLVQF